MFLSLCRMTLDTVWRRLKVLKRFWWVPGIALAIAVAFILLYSKPAASGHLIPSDRCATDVNILADMRAHETSADNTDRMFIHLKLTGPVAKGIISAYQGAPDLVDTVIVYASTYVDHRPFVLIIGYSIQDIPNTMMNGMPLTQLCGVRGQATKRPKEEFFNTLKNIVIPLGALGEKNMQIVNKLNTLSS